MRIYAGTSEATPAGTRPIGAELDHVVIAVRDLGEASETFRRAGFMVFPGGRHVGHGSENALVPLPRGPFLELLAVHDPCEAAASGINGRILLDQVERSPASLFAWCISTRDAALTLSGLEQVGAAPHGPVAITREGATWRLVLIDGVAYRRPWPFVIEHPDGRIREGHPAAVDRLGNGAVEITELRVDVHDLAAARALHAGGLGLAMDEDNTIHLGDVCIRFREVPTDGPLGEGPSGLMIRAREPERVDGLLELPIVGVPL